MRRLALLLVCATACVAHAADDSLARVRAAGVLRVAIDPTYPPMEFEKPDGSSAGFDIDFISEAANRIGVRAEFVPMAWDGIIAGLNSRRYDVIVSSMNITDERKKVVAFVEYARMAQVFVCKRGTSPVRDAAGLAGKVVAVQADTTSFNWLQDQIKAGLKVKELRALKDATDTFAAVKSGQAEVIVTDEPVGRYYAKQDAETYAVTGEAVGPEPLGAALHLSDATLRDALAEAVEAMRRDGTFRRLEEKWFGGTLGLQETEYQGFWRFSVDLVIPRLWDGMRLTLLLTLMSGFFGVLWGLVVALARLSRNRVLSAAALSYVTLFRGTPLLLQILFVFFAVPPLAMSAAKSLGIEEYGDFFRLSAMTSGVLALSLNAAAYIAEIFRAAIQSIDKGQMEAARALGMSHWQAMRRVILPQTLRRLIPPLVNELAALSKDTSLVSVVALHEMLYVTQRIAAAYLRPWEVYFWAAGGYLLIVAALSTVASRLEKRLEARE